MEYDSCVQSLINLRKANSKLEIEQTIKTVLNEVRTLLNIKDFSRRIGIVSKV